MRDPNTNIATANDNDDNNNNNRSSSFRYFCLTKQSTSFFGSSQKRENRQKVIGLKCLAESKNNNKNAEWEKQCSKLEERNLILVT